MSLLKHPPPPKMSPNLVLFGSLLLPEDDPLELPDDPLELPEEDPLDPLLPDDDPPDEE